MLTELNLLLEVLHEAKAVEVAAWFPQFILGRLRFHRDRAVAIPRPRMRHDDTVRIIRVSHDAISVKDAVLILGVVLWSREFVLHIA